MDSDTKTGRTEEESGSVLTSFQEKMSSELLSKWKRASHLAHDLAEREGIPEEHLEAFLKAFEVAYFRGAIDVSEINPALFRSKVH